jgi:iron complex outermembrane receptor protein
VLNPVDNASFNSFSWKVGLDKKVSDNVLLYGLVSEGFKTGGFSGGFSFGGPEQLLPFDDESILAYEIGLKSTGLGNRLRLNGAAFYYDYQDVQLFAFFTSAAGASIQVLSNAGNADILGVEAEIVYLATDALELSANVGWLDHELKDFQVDPTQPPVPGIPGPADANGNKLANTPDVNFTGAVKYGWSLDKGDIALRANFHYQSGVFFETFNQPFLSEDGYWLVDASLTYTLGDGTYEFSVWGQNLFEEERMTFGIPFQFSGFNTIVANQPRRYGVSFRYNFGK